MKLALQAQEVALVTGVYLEHPASKVFEESMVRLVKMDRLAQLERKVPLDTRVPLAWLVFLASVVSLVNLDQREAEETLAYLDPRVHQESRVNEDSKDWLVHQVPLEMPEALEIQDPLVLLESLVRLV